MEIVKRLRQQARLARAKWRLRRWVRRRDAGRPGVVHKPILESRFLYAAPIGRSGESQLRKLLARFEGLPFDYLIFVYDGHRFEGPEFARCRFIHEPGIVYYYWKKYVTPEVAARYDVIFLGVEDVEVDDFDCVRFVQTMRDNALDMAAPALSSQSITPHRIMYRQATGNGRLVDVIEVFLTAFDARAWPRFWELIEPDWNHWGWGYVQLAQWHCGFKMGLVDSQTVSVLRGPTFKQEALDSMHALFAKHPASRRASFVSYGRLK